MNKSDINNNNIFFYRKNRIKNTKSYIIYNVIYYMNNIMNNSNCINPKTKAF